MKNKTWGILFAMLFLLCIAGVSAAPTVSVSVGNYCQGTDTVTCTVAGGVSNESWNNYLWQSTSTTGAWTLLNVSTTATANQTTYSWTVDSTLLADGTRYFNCTIGINISQGNVSSTTLDSCTLDNTAPVASLSLIPDNGNVKDYLEADCSGTTDATAGVASYSILLRNPLGENTTAQTPSSGVADFYKEDLLYQDSEDGYTIYCTATDNAGNSGSTTQTFSRYSSDKKGVVAAKLETKEKANPLKLMLGIFGVAAFLVLVAGAVFAIKKSKKKKGRRR